MNESSKRKVLLTGAAGRIGSAFRHYAGNHYHFRLADRRASEITDPGPHEVLALDIADLQACQAACRDMETVVHLAADPSGHAGFYESLLDNNIKGVYNIFQAAKDQGCRRVIVASSVQAIEGYPWDVQAHPESPVKPLNMYGVTKCFAEAVAHCFAMGEGLSSIAIRVGTFEGNSNWTETPDSRNLSTFVSELDLSHLIVRCIETPDIQFAIVHGVSDNRYKRMDISSTRALVGYAPQDDAFERFNIGLRHRERWYKERPEPREDFKEV